MTALWEVFYVFNYSLYLKNPLIVTAAIEPRAEGACTLYRGGAVKTEGQLSIRQLSIVTFLVVKKFLLYLYPNTDVKTIWL